MAAVDEAQGPKKHTTFFNREFFLSAFVTSTEDVHVLSEDEWKYCHHKLIEHEVKKENMECELDRLEKDSDGYWAQIKEHEATLTFPIERRMWADELEGPELGPGYPVEARSSYDHILLKRWTSRLRGHWFTEGEVSEDEYDTSARPSCN